MMVASPRGPGSKFCTACGNPLRPGAAFCVSCGSPSAMTVPEDRDATRIRTATGPNISHQIDRFQIRAVIGKGRCGPVFRAFDPDLGRLVALRQLSAAVVSDPQWYSRLRLAVSRMAGIVDPHCVEIYSLVTESDPPVLLNEYIDGPSLQTAVFARGPLPAQAALVTLDGALAGLEHVHSLGLVHGYLTPTCVLLDHDGQTKLTDIGLGYGNQVARQAVPFLAPEVVAGQAPTVAADVFGAAAMMAFSLTGSPPAPGGLHVLPTQLRELLASAMSEDPSSRPLTVAAFKNAVREAAAEQYGSGWRDVGMASMEAMAAGGWLGLLVPDSVATATAMFSTANVATAVTVMRPVESVGASVAAPWGSGVTQVSASGASGGIGTAAAGSAAASALSGGAKVLIAAGTACALLVGGGAVAYTVQKGNTSSQSNSPAYPAPAPTYGPAAPVVPSSIPQQVPPTIGPASSYLVCDQAPFPFDSPLHEVSRRTFKGQSASVHTAVAGIQELVGRLGYTGLSLTKNPAIDGWFGKHTAFAVSEFQGNNNMQRTGQVDSSTWVRLQANC